MSDVQPTLRQKMSWIWDWMSSKGCKCRIDVALHILREKQQQLLDERIKMLTSHSIDHSGVRDMTESRRLGDVRRLVDSKNADNDVNIYCQALRALRAYRQTPFSTFDDIETHNGLIVAVLRIVYEIGFASPGEFGQVLGIAPEEIMQVVQAYQELIDEVVCANILLKLVAKPTTNEDTIIQAVDDIKNRYVQRILGDLETHMENGSHSYSNGARQGHSSPRNLATTHSSSGVFTANAVSTSASCPALSEIAPSQGAWGNFDSVSTVREPTNHQESLVSDETIKLLKQVVRQLECQANNRFPVNDSQSDGGQSHTLRQETRRGTAYAEQQNDVTSLRQQSRRNPGNSSRATTEYGQETPGPLGDSLHRRSNLSAQQSAGLQLTTQQAGQRQETDETIRKELQHHARRPARHNSREGSVATDTYHGLSPRPLQAHRESPGRVSEDHCVSECDPHTALPSPVRTTPPRFRAANMIPDSNAYATGARHVDAVTRDTVSIRNSYALPQRNTRFPMLDDSDNRQLEGVSVQERARQFINQNNKKP